MKTTQNPYSKMTSKVEEKIQQTEKYKEYRRRWRENPDNGIVEDFPLNLNIELNSTCNLKCTMCYYSYNPPKPVLMDFSTVKKIIDEGVKHDLCAIKLQFRGEPLLSKDLVKTIKYAKSVGILDVLFNTNATILTEEISKELIEAGLDKMIISLDGITKEVYEKIRRGGNFDTVISNITRFQELKKELGKDNPVVQIQITAQTNNRHQINDFIEFAKSIGIHNTSITEVQDYRINVDEPGSKDFICEQLWQRLFILSNGDVLPCCLSMVGAEYRMKPLGNVHKDSLADIWTGKEMSRLRELHAAGESNTINMCKICVLKQCIIHKRMEPNKK